MGAKRHRDNLDTAVSKYVCLDHFTVAQNLVVTHAMSKMHTTMFQNSDP